MSASAHAGRRSLRERFQLLLEEGEDSVDALLLAGLSQGGVLATGELHGNEMVTKLVAKGVEAGTDRGILLGSATRAPGIRRRPCP